MRRRSLRSRLILLVTVAVALAIAACAALSWFIVENQLIRQLDQSILEPEGKGDQKFLLEHCTSDGSPDYHDMATLLRADGSTCSLGSPIVPTEEDRGACEGSGGEPIFRNGVTRDGEAVRVVTLNFGPGVAVLEARPLYHIRITLRNTAILLAAVAAVGVLGAAIAGLLIARTALRPVGRLTKAVEHIAKTEDLDTRIPVTGDDEIARLSSSFNAMTTALAGSRERQKQLVADAGHELRTPLTTLRTNIDLLLRSEQTGRSLDPQAKERLLVNVKAQFAELTTLVADLLQLARGDTDHEPHVELPFHEVVTAAVERARLRGAEVVTELSPWYVVGGAASLERAVLNLIDNAAKFSPGGEVEVRLDGGRLTVRDHGPGLPEEELPHVFERFWRSPSARGLPGSGLGLAIVAQAVAEAGGEVRLANAPGGGAIATIRLPGTLMRRSETDKSV
ncbi:HAMP domain-containing protein [Nonomuraea phyllanthi]|uniref:Signal transduction histidine-protein kinase/phosphatase MprB n=1 Tax=Nonomuraea phyllanthi TaxID=2219224 RepID=A0A5C4V5N2_9ACTN|nr:HAMP domain-containing sensor histidine kinase [Nonomuraea phyllanthi]KAB8185715.1 HAMP domain-containing protein [Nonomuraea phyllanthi]QFY11217.1 HAMP domain-containing protein [Nonomuraea phyllanthi]